METLLLHEPSWRFLTYFLVFIGMLFEGEIVLFTAFFLASSGVIDFYDTLFFVVSGVIIGDILWYFAGAYLERRGWIPACLRPASKTIDTHLSARPFATLLFSKFTYGLHRPTLLRAKEAGIDLYTFIKMEVAASLLWIIVVGICAVLFSAAIGLFKKYLRFAEIGLLISVSVFILLSRLANSYYKKKARYK
ncbi:MAG: hypothetical protein HZC04_01550 [Candidatus Lloydbacteria bacterium]|nr:hypothetical protein [Candidatus Lloydbacteria bacterium]